MFLINLLTLFLLLFQVMEIKSKERKSYQSIEALSSMLEQLETCTIFTYGLKPNIIKELGIHLEEKSTLNNLQTLTFAYFELKNTDLTQLKMVSGCFVGVSTLEYSTDIQQLLLPTYKRQIVLLANSTYNNTREADLKVLRHHHPITVIEETNIPKLTHASLFCQSGKHMFINIFATKTRKWAKDLFLDRHSVERLCNDGRHPMFGQHLKASLYATRPFLFYPGHDSQATGVLIDVLTTMAGHLGFTFQGKWAENWWLFDANGTIGGSLGEVLHGEADISLDQVMPVAGLFGQLLPYTYSTEYVLFELKPNQVPQYANIVSPFDSATWTMLVLSLVCVSLTLKVVMYHRRQEKSTSCLDIVQMAFGVIFQEYHRSKKEHKQGSKQISLLLMIWVSATFFITMAFSGNLKSSLTRKAYEDPTKTINEVVDKDMIIHTPKVFHDYLLSPSGQSRPDVMRRVLCQAEKKNYFFQNGINIGDDSASRVLKHGGVSSNNEHSIEYVRTTYLRNGTDFPFTVIPERLFGLDQGMLLQNYDPRGEYLGPLLERMLETGITEHFMRLWMPYKDMARGQGQTEIDEEVLQLEHVCLPLAFLAGGIAVGSLGFMIEILSMAKYWGNSKNTYADVNHAHDGQEKQQNK